MNSEPDVIDPVPGTITLANGLEVQIEPLKTRQFFKLLRIVTRGASPVLDNIGDFLAGDSPEETGARMLGLVVFSIPEAENEAVEFIASMTKPVGLVEKPRNRQDEERNSQLWDRYAATMDNPDIDDTVTIIEQIVRRESQDLVALGKRLQSMLTVALKTGAAEGKDSPKLSSVSTPTA